ncbi:PPK2 family polyphosphate kinase [Allorhizocola rhizosphaerae]|uniref:PPK2 family polyphosphate kinase n=1 Tax=Allorhizocola rhizosphaerae TaxID=1872709 RepID=UPI001FE54CE0|nr:PPK2 family polyphosphate kinase [Allorhizocola rhizosphaerae]
MSDLAALLCAGPGLDLASIDTASTPGLPGKKAVRKNPKPWARGDLVSLGERLAIQQEMLYANFKTNGDRRRILLVLQAMDCGGKDGTIKKVAGALNPQGLRIAAFGPPTEQERRHDFLWRIRHAVPPPGMIGVFNRSHYEDVLVVRVRKLAPARVWRSRYQKINDFEEELAADGITLVKVMLHISLEEQRRRLLARLEDPTKHWKYRPEDVDNRAFWPAYQEAYQDVLARCGTDAAPWYVVPADRKWYRDWAVAHLMLQAFSGLGLRYPTASFDLERERKRLEEGTNK